MNNKQTFTSANTSINANKLPSAFIKVSPYGAVLDYGCGKYTEHIKNYVMQEKGDKFKTFCYFPYDKFNQSEHTNKQAIAYGKTFGYNTVYINNVLNVIDNENVIWNILYECFDMCNIGGKIVIQIYEGNKSGIGKETKNDCFQRNEKTKDYERFFGAFQGRPFTYKRTGNIIIVIKH